MSQQNKKKVLIFLPGGAGGAERMSVLIGKILPKDSFSVKYVVVGRLRSIYNIIPKGLNVDCIPVHNIYCFSMLRIWWKIIREKPDLVFASQAAYNSRVIIASKLAGCKVVIRSSGMIGRYKNKFVVKKTYPWANKLIAQQDEMRDDMISLLRVSPNKVVTVHNPIDCEEIDLLSSAGSPYPGVMDVKFVQVASVNHRKAQDISINAMAIVRKNIPNAHLYFVGSYNEKSSYFNDLQHLINHNNLSECIHFIGFDKNPFRWVKYADCFVFPSRNEGLPNALIEASYLGIPCVATRCLNIVDNIIKDGQNGYVVNIDDAKGLAQAMVKAVNIKECNMIYSPGSAMEFVNIFNNI